ncbi:MAG: hypothetical protein KAI83_06105 [Thiomargarita sp.]|nr:hypothetical protein [Thiomargarita sp.]
MDKRQYSGVQRFRFGLQKPKRWIPKPKRWTPKPKNCRVGNKKTLPTLHLCVFAWLNLMTTYTYTFTPTFSKAEALDSYPKRKR